MTDNVNHPKHYTASENGLECIDAIEAALTPDEFRGFCKGNALKYIWRERHKGKSTEDLEKAAWYSNRLVRTMRKGMDDLPELTDSERLDWLLRSAAALQNHGKTVSFMRYPTGYELDDETKMVAIGLIDTLIRQDRDREAI